MKKTLARRQFLQGATSAGTLLASNAVLLDKPSYAEGGKPPAASDRLRMGIIGIGMQGSGLLPNAIQLPGVECVAAADLYDGRHTLAKQITGNPNLPTTREYKELLDRKDIDCLIAAVPDFWHKQVVVDACNAGKDIYCEKPMSHTAEEGFDMVEAAARNKRIVQIGSQRVSSALCKKARAIRTGRDWRDQNGGAFAGAQQPERGLGVSAAAGSFDRKSGLEYLAKGYA